MQQVSYNGATMYTGCPIDSDIANIKSAIDSNGLDISNPVCKKNNRYYYCDGNTNSNLMCANPIPASFGSLVICQKQVNGKPINKYQTFYQDPTDCQDENTFIKM